MFTMPRFALAGLGALLISTFATAAVAGPSLQLKKSDLRITKDEWEEMVDDEDVVVREMNPTGGNGVAARAIGIINHPPAKVWPVIKDCNAYKRFMPRTEKSEIRKMRDGRDGCFIEVDMPIGFSNLWSLVYPESKDNGDGTYTRWWTMTQPGGGTYKHNRGSWNLFPHAGGSKTLLVYTIDVNPEVSLPDWVLGLAQTGALPDLFESIDKRTKKVSR